MSCEANVVLQPGELYFGMRPARISTLLGSCVSICLWHPQLKIGGMCHFMLPSRERARQGDCSARYADEAFDLFLVELEKTKTRPRDYELKLFGGGNMFLQGGEAISALRGKDKRPEVSERKNIAVLNVESAKRLAGVHGFNIKAEDLGGIGYRQVLLDLGNGRAWCRHHGGVSRGGHR